MSGKSTGVSSSSLRLSAKKLIARLAGPAGLEIAQSLHWTMRLGTSRFWKKEMAVVDRLVGPGDRCVDIGANFGQYTVRLARRVGPSGHVSAFEPVPFTYRVLKRVVGTLCRDNNVTVYNLALSNRREIVSMSIPEVARGVPQFGEAHVSSNGTGEITGIRCERTDDFLQADSLRFVKVDVEGAELVVLQGARQTLEKCRPIVLCEIEERHTTRFGHRPSDVADFFADLRYDAYRVEHGSTVATSISDIENNYFFIPREAKLP